MPVRTSHALILLLLLTTGIQRLHAAAYTVALSGNTTQLRVSEMRYLQDAAAGISPQLFYVWLLAGSIDTVTAMPFDRGYQQGRYLLGFSLTNSGEQPQSLQLATGVSSRPLLNIILFDDNGNHRNLLQHHGRAGFEQRPVAAPELYSRAFRLAPGQTVYIVIEYETNGDSYLPLTLGTGATLAQQRREARYSAMLYYGTGMLLLLCLAAWGIVKSSRVALAYSLLFALAWLTIASIEGYAFQYLWPARAQWNHDAPLLLLYSLSALGLLVARMAVFATDNNTALHRAMTLAAMLSLLLALATPFISAEPLQAAAGGLVTAMFAAHIYAWFNRLSRQPRLAGFAFPLALLLLLSASALLLISQNHALAPTWLGVDALRILTLIAQLGALSILPLTRGDDSAPPTKR